MRIGLNIAALHETRWNDYAVRFLFGGAVTAATGLIAKRFGPGIAGLFLAFPAIFPASSTLIDKQQKRKKERAGMDGSSRARSVVSVDAAGSAMGALGLITFALVVWRFLPKYSPSMVMSCAGLAWLAVSVGAWYVRKTIL